ncbi:MAG: helix-turn-helix domain-containing protein [Methanosarcinales archaeon]|nr:helix-turn-helix domain-containing protein [Methanosarcinales archaeon]
MPPAGTSAKEPITVMDNRIENAPVSSASETVHVDDVIIVPVNEASKKLRQIFSNETSMKILDLLKKESLAANEVADRLEIPLTTVKYNIDQMVEHDLVRVQRIKYSEKGRQVKIYEAPEKVIIFAPEKINRVSLASMLQKYAFAFIAAAFAGFGLHSLYLRHLFAAPAVMMEIADDAVLANESVPAEGMEETLLKGSEILGGSFVHDAIMAFNDWFFNLMGHHAFWFILGALFVCAVIWVFEYAATAKDAKSE